MKRIAFALAAALSASACSELPVEPSPPADAHAVCRADTLGWTLGKPADEALVQRARLEATAKIARVLRPGQVVTMEYSDQRLNLYVDEKNVVTRYACS